MNVLNRNIVQSIKKLNNKVSAQYAEIFANLEKRGIVALNIFNWNKPSSDDFEVFGDNAKLYMESYYMIKTVDVDIIKNLLNYPDCYVYVTADEIKKFETVTYPKLYAKWLAKKDNANAKENLGKIHTKITNLQNQIDKIKAQIATVKKQ